MPTKRLPRSPAPPAVLLCAVLAACGGGAGDGATAQSTTPPPTPAAPAPAPATPTALDQTLRARIDALQLTGNPAANLSVENIDDPLPQLGMRLFFSKSLGGDFDSACVSCHHPDLGGGDALALPIGVAAVDPHLLGIGREAADGILRIGRNAPTTFNAALADRALFDDGRIESLNPRPGANGAVGGIRTPDSAFGVADPDAGDTLPAAQSRFPIVTPEEMLGGLLPDADHETVRDHLAQRIGGYGTAAGELARNNWLPLFQSAFTVAGSAQTLVTEANIASAIGAYERSQLFVDSDWRRYVEGDLTAISDAAKRGATLFLTPANQGGAGCNACHRGDLFSDQNFHTAAFPQIGPGKGDGADGGDDFGRERESGDPADLYAYRTPSLLNVALSAPYGHAGAYATLTDVVNHYRNPRGSVTNYVSQHGWCALPQFADLPAATCNALFPDAAANSNAALGKLQADRNAGRLSIPNIQINDGDVADIVAFLNTLTDRCAADADCRAQWIPPRDGGPDGEQLDAVDVSGNPL